jgi:hypothetical protein
VHFSWYLDAQISEEALFEGNSEKAGKNFRLSADRPHQTQKGICFSIKLGE